MLQRVPGILIERLSGYSTDKLKLDVTAGITVALVLIPQSMAYAQLAGLPPHYGLYAAFLPPIIGALFGSSRQLSTGPVAVVSLMTAVALAPLAATGSQGYIAYALLLALLVGLFQLCLGVMRLGLLVNFLSHPVVNGFTNAAAIIIASSQLSKLFGVHVDKAARDYQTIVNIFQSAAHHTHWPTFFMGVLALAIIYGLKHISPRFPNVLVAVVVTTLLSFATDFEKKAAVPLAAIQPVEVRNDILEFNRRLDAAADLTARRVKAGERLSEALKNRERVLEINIRRDLEIIDLDRERFQSEARDLRKKLRHLLLEGVNHPERGLLLYPRSRIPEGLVGDGEVWRLEVGNQLLKTDSLVMTAGGEVIGGVPRGLPVPAIPELDPGVILYLLPFTVIISLVGFMEAISVAKAMAAQTGQRIDPNRELIGQGLANIIGAIGRSYPTSGSFSRSAINLQSGALSGLSSVFTGLTVVIFLLFFTPLLYHLPQSVLAAIIMVAVVGLINVNGIVHSWRAQWYDGAIALITFICTLAFAPHLDRGILVGVVLSLSVFLYKNMRPTVVDLSLGVDKELHDTVEFGIKECRYIDIVRFDGPLFFANAGYMEDQIRMRRRTKKQLKHIIIVANGINDIDATGEEALSLSVDRLRSAGIDISLCGVNESVMHVLVRTHLLAKIGEDHIYATTHSAINSIYQQTHTGGVENDCPLVVVTALSD